MKMNPVIHFEMPAVDKERMKTFYTKTFGWEMNQLGPEMGNYTVVMTAKSDEKGPLERGMINGGFFESVKEKAYPSIVISVDDIHEAMKKVKDAGGKILGGGNPNKKSAEDPDDIPGVGLYASFVDTEGNRVGMLQPSEMM